MAGSPITSALGTDEDDSDWEYEYHETETESFYVILDISSASDYNNPRTKNKPDPPPPKLPQPTTSIAPTSPRGEDNAGPSEPPETPIPETPAPMDIDQPAGEPEEDPSLSGPKDRIQFLDLHTQNPLISYQGQMYSCEWTSTLGTDLLLTTPAPDFPHPILREKPHVSVVAASTIKLIGRPAKIISRYGGEEGDQLSNPAPESSIAPANTASPEKATSVKIPIGAVPSHARQNQADFLERLIAIKTKKGEKDNVTVYTKKTNQGTGWRSRRRASEAFEDGDDEPSLKQDGRGRATVGRPRGSKRTKGVRTAKGGLFRDYRPQLWDTPGADIRAGPSLTPESWDQLENAASDERQTPAITTTNASPSPADKPEQTANTSTRSRSESASAHAPPTPSSRPVEKATGEGISSAELATPSPSLALALEPQPATAMEESVLPASGVPDAGPLQQKQTESLIAGQSTPALDTEPGTLETSGGEAAGDMEMEDA